jgi:hypothetical protein
MAINDVLSAEADQRPLRTVEECLKETRTISYLLHPPLLDEAGFESESACVDR